MRDPSANALIAEHGADDGVASAFAWYQTAKSVAASVSQAAAGILLTITAGSYSTVFFLAFALSLLPIVVVHRYVKSDTPTRGGGHEGELSGGAAEVAIEPAGAEAIARRSRGTPRIANRLLRRVRDYCQVRGDGVITAAAAADSLDREGVDAMGLDRLDCRFLKAIIEQYGGGPVGLEAIAATINDEAETLVEVVEPFLLKIGYIVRSPNGRRATPAAYAHLGCALPLSPGGQTQLPL